MKNIEFTSLQISTLENGANRFIFPAIGLEDTSLNQTSFPFVFNTNNNYKMMTKYEVLRTLAPIQKGDKDIFVKESFYIDTCGIINYKDDFNYIPQLAYHPSRMTKEQSRYSFSECIDVRIIRIQELVLDNIVDVMGTINIDDSIITAHDKIRNNFKNYYNALMKQFNCNRTYDENDYIFLIKLKKKDKNVHTDK